MAVGVLVGDILSVWGHKEALQGMEVIRTREPGPEEVVVIIGSIGLLGGQDDFHGWPEGIIGGSDAVGIEQRMVTVGPGVLGGGLGTGVQGNTVELVSFKGEANYDVAGAPPASGQGKDVGVACELSIIPGLAIVAGVILPEDVVGGLIEDIDLSSISSDSAGTGAVGGDLRPLRVVGARAGVGDFLAVENIAGCCPDAVHGALAVEGDAMVVVGLGAFIEPRPGEPLDARLIVIDLSLDIGKAVGLLLSG